MATGLGLGYLPFAPGTWGSLLGILLAYGLSFLSLPIASLTLIAFIFFAIWCATHAETYFKKKDASQIVIDEVCGMAISLFCIPFTLQNIFIAFLLFRLFDIVKPFPARLFEQKLKGGYGIVLDDVMAGIYANVMLQGIRLFL